MPGVGPSGRTGRRPDRRFLGRIPRRGVDVTSALWGHPPGGPDGGCFRRGRAGGGRLPSVPASRYAVHRSPLEGWDGCRFARTGRHGGPVSPSRHGAVASQDHLMRFEVAAMAAHRGSAARCRVAVRGRRGVGDVQAVGGTACGALTAAVVARCRADAGMSGEGLDGGDVGACVERLADEGAPLGRAGRRAARRRAWRASATAPRQPRWTSAAPVGIRSPLATGNRNGPGFVARCRSHASSAARAPLVANTGRRCPPLPMTVPVSAS